MQKKDTALRRELSFIEAIALSIGIMAPPAAMALNGSLAAGITGSAVPLAFLLAAVAVGLASFSFIQFSRFFAHSGSVYGFNGVALGPRAGFFSGWALLGTYLAFTGASTAEVGNLTAQPFTPGNQPLNNIGLAAVFGFLSFAGFEGALPHEESDFAFFTKTPSANHFGIVNQTTTSPISLSPKSPNAHRIR